MLAFEKASNVKLYNTEPGGYGGRESRFSCTTSIPLRGTTPEDHGGPEWRKASRRATDGSGASRDTMRRFAEEDMRFLDTLRPVGALVLRLALGLIFIYHGYPKLFGNPGHYAEMFAQIGFAKGTSYAIGALEMFGGALLVAGFFTRPIALLLTAEMAVAIWKVHSKKGCLAVSEYEFALIVGAAALALATFGPGVVSLDELLIPAKKARPPIVRG